MSWLHMETATKRKPTASLRARPMTPLFRRRLMSPPAASSTFCPGPGCGCPAELNQPTPPPCMWTQSGRVSVAEEPTLVPMTNVW